MRRSVTVAFDYRCPFAYNGNLATLNAIRAGSDIDFRFVPFSLDQVHVEEGATPVWDLDPSEWGTGLRALLFGVAVRDHHPDHFFDAHLALFATRHEYGLKLDDEAVLRDAVASVGLDPDVVADRALDGSSLATVAKEHTELVDGWGVFGVPTFIEGDDAAFVRFMDRGNVDDLERMLDLLTWSALNEFKRPRVPR